MRDIRKVVVTGGLGAVGSAYVRALVPAGYDVTVVDIKSDAKPRAFGKLSDDWIKSPETVERVLRGEEKIDPFLDLGNYAEDVPCCSEYDLSELKWGISKNPFQGADAVILTAANSDPHQTDRQNKIKGQDNFGIDFGSMDYAINAGAGIIIYTSSVWRTMNLVGKKVINPETDDDAPELPYARMKSLSVDSLKKCAVKNPDRIFIFNDHGWYPRETMGAPPSNLSGKDLQFWVAECEMQMHILRQLRIVENPEFAGQMKKGKNCFGFNVVSNNVPTIEGHPGFSYDLSASEKLGVPHEFNVHKVLASHDASWRRIPAVMH